MPCDPTDLSDAAKCIEQCVPQGMQLPVLIWLMCQIADGGTGGGGTQQVYSTTATDPNAPLITPEDPAKGAIFYQDPPLNLNEWKWSISLQTWQQTSQP